MGRFAFPSINMGAFTSKLNPISKPLSSSSSTGDHSLAEETASNGSSCLEAPSTAPSSPLKPTEDPSQPALADPIVRPATAHERRMPIENIPPPSQGSSERRHSRHSVLRRLSLHNSRSTPAPSDTAPGIASSSSSTTGGHHHRHSVCGGSIGVGSSVNPIHNHSSNTSSASVPDPTKMPSEAQIYHLIINANEHFEKEQFNDSINAYSRAIVLIDEIAPGTPAAVEDLVCMLYSNRSMAYFMRGDLHDSLRDAEKVVQTRPLWSKGHFRKGEALLALGMFELAVIHYGFASDLEPGNRELRIFAQKAHFLRQDREQGLAIYQLLSGRDIAHTRSLNPIQNKIFDFAKKMRNFVYLIVDRESKQCAVVDACWDVPGIMRVIKKEQLTLVAAIVTHYHFDHVGGIPPAPFDALHIRVSGLDTVLRKFPHVKAYIHTKDIPFVIQSNPGLPVDRIQATEDGFRMTLGARTSLQFLHTPGHSEGSQCILVNDGRLFTGDTLFPTSCGRVDLPGGCKKDMLHSLQNVLKHLDPSIMIYPGHDYGGAWSTIETEQQSGLLRDGYTAEWDEFNNLQLP
ncbi:hypothetical protein H4R33_004572 [Dimargaris cristalligena]|nr:hypothetical protein H4R33_004572 [Dimargaris cristalligena]